MPWVAGGERSLSESANAINALIEALIRSLGALLGDDAITLASELAHGFSDRAVEATIECETPRR
jgi:hypothetical protein